MAVKPMGHSRQRSVDLNGVRSAAQGQGSMSTSTQNSTVPAAEAIFDFESKEAAEKELLMLRNVAVKKDEESAKLMLEVYRHRAIRKESCKINEEIETARAEILKEQEKAQEARASAEQWKAQMEQYRHEMEHLRASADKVPGLTQELKEAKAQQAALEVEMQQWRKEAEELRSKLEAVEKEREADLQLHAQQAQRELSPSHETMAQTSLNGHTPKAKSSESFHERSAKAGRPRKNICMVPTSGSPELTPGSVTRCHGLTRWVRNTALLLAIVDFFFMVSVLVGSPSCFPVQSKASDNPNSTSPLPISLPRYPSLQNPTQMRGSKMTIKATGNPTDNLKPV
ncbi:unnamed protein product [Symbiodinium microadriaticum]|nr:unnamed protein product [Symbiodinium sp. KB8]CAE7840126.1 unnamed protein product [Symbiodinium microadriaticum]